MAKLFIYLLESGAVLACFYLLYILVLRRETFFSLNRFFLIGILIFSLLFPLLSFDFNSAKVMAVERPLEEISKLRKSYYEAMALWEFSGRAAAADHVDEGKSPVLINSRENLIFNILLMVYIIGILVCLSRLAWTFTWIRKMIKSSPQVEVDGMKIIKLSTPIAPFSFLQYVFVHHALVNTPDFDQILAHEKTHIQERHSFDLIFVQLLAAFLWFNPVIWWLIKSLKTTHEYIADKKIISSGYSLVAYQTLLLRQLISNNSYGLVHNFNLSFIKKRITMMKNKSGWSGKVKVAMAMICTVIFSGIMVQCNSSLEEEAPTVSELTTENAQTKGLSLPTLTDSRDPVALDLKDALYFAIADDQLTINGKPYKVDEIVSMIKKEDYSHPVTIIMSIDKDQEMGFISDVQMELRKADQRKIVYVGQTHEGKSVKTRLLLPPFPNSQYEKHEPSNEEMSAAGLDILKIDLGETKGAITQKQVYDFVISHMKKQSSAYVVSARFDDDDTYNDYLVNLVYVKAGFNQLYQERAQEMFGRDYDSIGKEEFKAVREGIPMAISIAEREL